jgi:hypothetical protein
LKTTFEQTSSAVSFASSFAGLVFFDREVFNFFGLLFGRALAAVFFVGILALLLVSESEVN